MLIFFHNKIYKYFSQKKIIKNKSFFSSVSSIDMLGLIFEVSSLFSVVIGTLELPISPILAFMIFDDKISGVKVMA